LNKKHTAQEHCSRTRKSTNPNFPFLFHFPDQTPRTFHKNEEHMNINKISSKNTTQYGRTQQNHTPKLIQNTQSQNSQGTIRTEPPYTTTAKPNGTQQQQHEPNNNTARTATHGNRIRKEEEEGGSFL